jgi:hypothetical protein
VNPQNRPWAHLIPHFHSHRTFAGKQCLVLRRGALRGATEASGSQSEPCGREEGDSHERRENIFLALAAIGALAPVTRLIGPVLALRRIHQPAFRHLLGQLASLMKLLRFLGLTGWLAVRRSSAASDSFLLPCKTGAGGAICGAH